MFKIKILLPVLILSFACHYFALAQTRVVRGQVYAFKDLSLTNILVTAKKASTSVKTDSLGEFSIVCMEKDKLTFTGHGFEKAVRNIKNTDTLSVKMFFEEGADNEEIAVGYGHVSKDKLLNSISNFSSYNSPYANYTDIYELIKVEFPEISVSSGGGSQPKITIRGVSSLNPTSPLFIIDGTPVEDISFIPPSTVKSISILKDGATTIYGSRGANGVILITTKN